MKNNELISIIVPVYNVENYFRKCIDSIIKQTYQNIEIILVDDKSPDNCGKICDDYSKKDNRIKVIHNKENEGVANTRNIGLKQSIGEYITFVDSDDIIESDYIEYLYRILREYEADIACCNFEYIYEEKNNKIVQLEEKILSYDKNEALKSLLYQKELDTSPWGKLYSRKVFNNIYFPSGMIYEDFGTIYKTFIQSQKIVYSNQKKYLYLQRENSTIGRKFNKKDFDMLFLSKQMEKDITKVNPDLKNAINSRIISMDFYFIRRIDKKAYKEQYHMIKDDIKKRRKKILKDKDIKVKTRIAIYISYINIYITKYIYNFINVFNLFGIKNYLKKYKK